MEPITAGLLSAAPSLLGALFGALAPKPKQPLPMAPSLMSGERLQLGMEEPRQGPSPGQLVLDGLLSGGLGALGAYAQQPAADSGMLSPRQYAAQQSLGNMRLASPLLESPRSNYTFQTGLGSRGAF
jgi:hypothetical protein